VFLTDFDLLRRAIGDKAGSDEQKIQLHLGELSAKDLQYTYSFQTVTDRVRFR
jgi:hypothetical protein